MRIISNVIPRFLLFLLGNSCAPKEFERCMYYHQPVWLKFIIINIQGNGKPQTSKRLQAMRAVIT